MRRLKITLWVIVAMLCSIPISQAEQKGSPETSSVISFKIKNAGIFVDGKFENFTIDIQYDAKNPEKSTFQGIIQVASINTGISMRDGHLRKSEYFDTENFPEIRFRSLSVKSITVHKILISGLLTIRDVTKPVNLEIDITENNGRQIFTTSLQINRRDYGVGGKNWMMSDEVKIDIRIIE
ncbi:MAG: YceI family protein [Cyclobacteriaceae bacterium]|nr:YceI family protein [Cyclobacteriaceae bacterium]